MSKERKARRYKEEEDEGKISNIHVLVMLSNQVTKVSSQDKGQGFCNAKQKRSGSDIQWASSNLSGLHIKLPAKEDQQPFYKSLHNPEKYYSHNLEDTSTLQVDNEQLCFVILIVKR